MKINWYASRLNIINPLWALNRMIEKMSLKLSAKAKMRLKWMDHYNKKRNAALTCRHFDISESTFWFWHKRYDPQNLKSLEDRSKKPKSSPKKTAVNIIIQVIKLKKQYPRWGKEKLAIVLERDYGIKLSASTIYRICKKYKLSFKYKTKKRLPKKSNTLPKNWQKTAPGDLIEIDTKVFNVYGKKYYQFTAIDYVSKWRYLRIKNNKNENNGLEFIKELKNKTPFQIKMIKSDNGGEFKNKLVQNYLKENNIKYSYIHKGRPTENGTVERSHRTDEEEFYSINQLLGDIDSLNKQINQHCYIYNYVRPHWSLNNLTPIEYLKINYPQYVLT